MRVLLDTNVISELRRPSPDVRVVRCVRELGSEDSYLSVITIGELVYGVKRLAAGAKRTELESWLAAPEQGYAARILPIDTETTHIWRDRRGVCGEGVHLATTRWVDSGDGSATWASFDDKRYEEF